MIFFGSAVHDLTNAESSASFFGIVTILIVSFVGFIRWVANAPRSPDPWNDRITADLAADDCQPVCHRCFTLHTTADHFCPECGAMVGEYTSLLPPLYYIGFAHTLRIGTEGAFRQTAWLRLSYLVIGLAAFVCFTPLFVVAPIFCYKILQFPKPQDAGPPINEDISQT